MGTNCANAETIRILLANETVEAAIHHSGHNPRGEWIVDANDKAIGNNKAALCFTNRVVVLSLPLHLRDNYAYGAETVRATFHERVATNHGTVYDVFVLVDGNKLFAKELPEGTRMKVLEAGAPLVEPEVEMEVLSIQVANKAPFEIKKGAGPLTMADAQAGSGVRATVLSGMVTLIVIVLGAAPFIF